MEAVDSPFIEHGADNHKNNIGAPPEENGSPEFITPDFVNEHYNNSESNSPAASASGEHNSHDKNSNSKQQDASKICGVCGDKALGNNFNAITCESCKAFFRRNALKTKEFICPFNDNCKVDPVTRRFCQKCRLKKCFDIGMKKEWIMTDEEKKMKKTKIEQNRLKRQSSDTLPTTSSCALGSPSMNKISCLSSSSSLIMNENSNHSNPSTPGSGSGSGAGGGGGSGPISLVVPCSPTTIPACNNSNYHHHPSHIQTPSPPDPTLPYTKGSKIAVTPTTSSRMQYQQQNSNNNYNTTAEANFITNDNSSDFPGLLTTISNSQRHSALITSSNNSQRKFSTSNNTLIIESNNNSNNNLSARNIQDSEHQQQVIWCSGESSSSSSSSLPYSSPAKDVGSHPSLDHHHHQQIHSIIPSGFNGTVVGGRQLHQQQHIRSSAAASGSGGTSYKLLTSLIRPGITESPPDSDLIDCSSSNIAKPSDEYSVIKQISFLDKRIAIAAAAAAAEDEEVSNDSEYIEFGSSSTTHHHQHQHNHQHQQQAAYHNNSNPSTSLDAEEISIEQPLPLNTMDSILSVAIKAEFNAFGVLGRPHCGIQNSRELNNAERAKLSELLSASQALNAPIDAENPIKVSEGTDHSLINVINLTDIAIRRLIKMAKKISGFKNMCQEDQIALLKGGCTEMMILRSVVTYDPDRDSWNIPHSNFGYNIKLGVLKEARGNLYEEHQRFAKSFKSSWRLDENIMIILCAITLFTPERPNVIHKDVVRLEQDSYYYLLKRYLESIVNGCEARLTYLDLIKKIAELHNLNSNHLRVFLEVNPREVEPLLIEIFDLK